MSITYTAGWYALWRGIVVYLYFDYPYLLRASLFLLLFFLLPLPFLVWGGAGIKITAGVTGSWAGAWGITLLLGAAEDVLRWTTKPYTVSISEKGVRNEAWYSKAVMKWSDVIKIMCVEDGVVIFQNGCGGGFFVPASAFENSVQAQQFHEQAVNYWRDATGRFRGTE